MVADGDFCDAGAVDCAEGGDEAVEVSVEADLAQDGCAVGFEAAAVVVEADACDLAYESVSEP